MRPSVQNLHAQIRAGMWRPLAETCPAFTNGIANRWEGLPFDAPRAYIAAVMRLIELVPEHVVKSFDETLLQQMPVDDRRALARITRDAISVYGAKPREIEQLFLSLIEHTQLAEGEGTPMERRKYEAYVRCADRFLDFCAWIQVCREQDLALKTSSGDIVAPVLSDKPERKLRLVR